MPKPTLAAIVLAGITVLSSTAMAGPSTIDPTYIGTRSANPEQETYGYVVTTQSEPCGSASPVRLAMSVPLPATPRRTRSGTGRCSASKGKGFDHSGSSGSEFPYGPLAPSIDF